ncbi:MAG: hypothetical protein RL497_2817 [Pseudomonadota bacterium]
MSEQNSPPEPIVWADTGKAVTQVAHTSGGGWKASAVSVVTESGQLFIGNFPKVKPTPYINSGVISISGGYFAMCALVKTQLKKDVICLDPYEGSKPERPIGLPDDFDVVQIVVRWNHACALNTLGKTWCWDQRSAAHAVDFSGPVKMLSKSGRGDSDLCALKFDGTVECKDGTAITLPSTANEQIFNVNSRGFLAIDAIGNGTTATAPFALKNVVGAGGTNPTLLVTKEGGVFRLNGDSAVKIEGAKAQAAECAY